MHKKATAGLLTGALALAVLAASATAAPVASRVTIHKDPAFHGRVIARAAPRCRKHREIRVFLAKSKLDSRVGSGVTRRNGHWSIPVKTHHGEYYAVARRKVLANGTVCRRGVSRTISVRR